MPPEDIVKAITLVAALVIGLGALIGAYIQARSFIREPFERMKADHDKEAAALRADLEGLIKIARELQVHFDAHGGNLRTRVADIEKRINALDMNGAAERAELAGLIRDLRPILIDLNKARP